MSYIRTLKNYNYDFKNVPIDVLENVNLILSHPISNTKIDLLDAITFNRIRQTQPTNDIIETLYDVYMNEDTIRDNNGFNSLKEIDEAIQLYSPVEEFKTKNYYNSLIPKGYSVAEIIFKRAAYDYLSAKDWLIKLEFDLSFPELTPDNIIFKISGKPISKAIELTDNITAHLTIN